MSDSEQRILLTTLEKMFILREAVSWNDFDRFITAFQAAPFAISSPNQDEVAGLHSRLIMTIKQKFNPQQQNAQ